jgi:UDP-N-acetylmuramate dehydrogenase
MVHHVTVLSPLDQRPSTESLAQHTTVGLGGPAADWRVITTLDQLRDVSANRRGEPVLVLGGGSNVVCADAGFPGIVLAIQLPGIHLSRVPPNVDGPALSLTAPNASPSDSSPPLELSAGQAAWLHVAAGEVWDDVVAATCRWDLAGIECLSGIPGRTGATPIQNVGAYGQELSDNLWRVSCIELATGNLVHFSADECGLGYRQSRFKNELKGRYVVVEVVLRLTFHGSPTLTYAEIARRFADVSQPSLCAVREVVLATRKNKSLVFDRTDPNSRNCGSFFVNPVIDVSHHRRIQEHHDGVVPCYPAGPNTVKVPAAWLIEHAGFAKGERRGNVGLSTKHTLCLVAYDDATSDELLAFAREIRDGVRRAFDVELVPEPVFVGLTW